MAHLLIEKIILSLQHVQIVCIFILLNGKCIFIKGIEKNNVLWITAVLV